MACCGTKLRGLRLGLELGQVWNRSHEIQKPQLRPQLQKFSNSEVGNLKLRLLVTGVEALEAQVGVELGDELKVESCLKHPIHSYFTISSQISEISKQMYRTVPIGPGNLLLYCNAPRPS